MNHRCAVTINDSIIGTGKSISVTCMYCSDMLCMTVCLADRFHRTEDGVMLCDKDVCIGCGYCSYARPFGASQFPGRGAFGVRGKIDKRTFCVDGPEENGSEEEFRKYGHDRLAEGKLLLYTKMCSTKALLGGDDDIIFGILHNRVMRRGKDVELFGWGTAYGGAQDKGGQAASATPAVPAKSASASGAQS